MCLICAMWIEYDSPVSSDNLTLSICKEICVVVSDPELNGCIPNPYLLHSLYIIVNTIPIAHFELIDNRTEMIRRAR